MTGYFRFFAGIVICGDFDFNLFPAAGCYEIGVLADGKDRFFVGDVISFFVFSKEQDFQQSGSGVYNIGVGAYEGSLAMQDDIFVIQGITKKSRGGSVVAGRHGRAIGVAGAGNDDLEAVLLGEGDAKCLSCAFAVWIAGADIQRIDKAVICFFFCFKGCVAVYFARGDVEYAGGRLFFRSL